MSIPTIPPVAYQVAFNAAPNQTAIPPWWSDLSSRVQFPWTTSRGRQYELDQNETGEWRPTLANSDGALDPSNTASPYAPNVVPYRQCRIRVTPGPNLLTPDQATAGEVTGYGPQLQVPAQMGVNSGAGYAVSLAFAADAFQGTQVYQTAIPNGATSPKDLWDLTVPVVAGTVYSGQVQARMLATAQTVNVHVSVNWLNAAGGTISTTVGGTVALVGGSTTWLQVPNTGTAPAGAVLATIRVVLGTTTTATASLQVDGVQWEANSLATTWQQPNTTPVNMLPEIIASGSQSLAATDSWFRYWFASGPGGQTLTQLTGLAAAPSGHTVALGWQTPIGTTSTSILLVGNYLNLGTTGPQPDIVQVVTGTTYTASWWCSRASSADATVAVTPGIRWCDQTGALISTTAGTAVTVPVTPTWSARVTVSGAAPAGAMWGRLAEWITTPATTTAQNTIYHTGYQCEAAASASTWVDPGTVYQILNGFVERWPETWSEQNGTYGTSDVVVPDQLTALAQYTLPAPFVAEVLTLAPNFFYQLNDPAGSSSCADVAGRRFAAPIENSPGGVGSLVLGSSVTSTNSTGAFVGTPGPVATFANNPSDPTSGALAETFVSIHKTGPTPGPPPNGNWTRIVHFRCPTAPTVGNAYSIWEALPPTFLGGGNGSAFNIGIAAGTNQIDLLVQGATGGLVTNTNTTNYCDGNWHQAVITVNGSGNVAMYMDGAAVSTSAASITLPISGCTSDAIGASVQFGAQTFRSGMVGDIACAIELPFVANSSQITNLYNSWRNASQGESSGARIQRILKWVGWSGPTSIATGQTASMGPASDLTGDAGLDAINAVVLTENGNFYASNQGVLTFQARNARYNQNVPTYTFGEQTSAGEWPFELLYFEDDPSHIANNVQITQYGGSVYTAIDQASTQNNFPRVYQRTINTTSVPECQDAANYLLSQYKGVAKRVQQLRLHPSAVPGLFNVCLNLEIGTLIQVNRRPNGAPLTSFTGFVEKVAWTWDPQGHVYVDLQCSPVNKTQYWVLGALHTTLNVQANSGTNTITINALPDAAVNKLNQSLPSGYQLVLDPANPALQETVTIAPGGIPATSLGYSTAVLTLTSNLNHTHAANAVVCELIPEGITDPTTFDLLSVLGAASTTFALAATAGTNTITINALSDAKANAIASSIPQGWTIWLSPGTANFEAVTVSPTGVPVTYPGYATVTLTLTANLAHNHALNDVVCDVLPAGDTSPSQILATTVPAY